VVDDKSAAAVERVRVWDLPTRVFHWGLMACIVGSVLTAKLGGNAMVWHFRLGYVALSLLLFRLLWGVLGGRWSRFGSFVHAPGTVWRYLRGRTAPREHLEVGHSPLGGLSVLALLLILLGQASTGLLADDEIASAGPLVAWVSGAVSSRATWWHTTWGQWVVLGLVALHVAAIAYYRVARRVNLVGPMLTGDKPLPPSVPATQDGRRQRLLATVLWLFTGAVVFWLSLQGA
jgi:cytochrome b